MDRHGRQDPPEEGSQRDGSAAHAAAMEATQQHGHTTSDSQTATSAGLPSNINAPTSGLGQSDTVSDTQIAAFLPLQLAEEQTLEADVRQTLVS